MGWSGLFRQPAGRFELPSSMSTRQCENSEVSEGLGRGCEGVCWSTEADWIEEWLAAWKAASHRFLLGGGLCPLAPCGRLPPGSAEAIGNSDCLPRGLCGGLQPERSGRRRGDRQTPRPYPWRVASQQASVAGRSQSMAGARLRRRAAPMQAGSGALMRRPLWQALPAATPDSGAARRSAE